MLYPPDVVSSNGDVLSMLKSVDTNRFIKLVTLSMLHCGFVHLHEEWTVDARLLIVSPSLLISLHLLLLPILLLPHQRAPFYRVRDVHLRVILTLKQRLKLGAKLHRRGEVNKELGAEEGVLEHAADGLRERLFSIQRQ